jgi:hypothetical protein
MTARLRLGQPPKRVTLRTGVMPGRDVLLLGMRPQKRPGEPGRFMSRDEATEPYDPFGLISV